VVGGVGLGVRGRAGGRRLCQKAAIQQQQQQLAASELVQPVTLEALIMLLPG
jgi:hypothetical protein